MGKITKEQFAQYNEIRKRGEYNMFMEAYKVAEEMKTPLENVKEIIMNYEYYHKLYGE